MASGTNVDQNTLRRRGVGLIAHDPARAWQGYTLFAPIAEQGRVYLVDMEGQVVHEWDLPYPPGRHARLLPDGNLFYQGKDVDGPTLFPIWGVYHGGVLAEVAPDGSILREVRHPYHHHDAVLLANGNLAVLTVERLDEATARRVRGGVPGSEAPDGSIWADVVVEMTWSGDVVWRWSAAERLAFEDAPLDAHFAREHWPMANTVSETSSGDLLIGFRSASTVVRVARATGDVEWQLSAPVVSQQHYPHELDNGNILVFDNGSFRDSVSYPYSRAVEVDPETNTVVWDYTDNPPQNFYSPYMSSAQRLPNGNTLITEGSFGRIFEVTPDREVVWEYVIPYFGSFGAGVGLDSSQGANNSVFRAYRYGPEVVERLREGGALS
ncbi:aryl sulfotransferase [Rhodococcus triatomae]|uniref:Arylsulfotransferase (ASST) n=1 Tax=Rhodococcus triatomae TaxID=300028 RepID=A0A1G8GJI4_9NOCA|nr:aryl-sulfate sulfotransferase [Rhodococcus triatomae]QNG20359.1 aryl sulfotransferase [Rhodococcus triatomae]QNG23725.1 aryl sulfotransferase [Rhodococcus triatomae]SDH94559.1 Arylsulfotransferase (ASST) [Rhodococcus triatomae]